MLMPDVIFTILSATASGWSMSSCPWFIPLNISKCVSGFIRLRCLTCGFAAKDSSVLSLYIFYCLSSLVMYGGELCIFAQCKTVNLYCDDVETVFEDFY